MVLDKGIVYYTDNRLDETLANTVREQLLKARLPIVSVSLKPIDFGKNICLSLDRGYSAMFQQILVGLKASEAKYVFMCEHDVLYSLSHFDFTPPKDDVYYYNSNAYKYKLKGRVVVKYDHRWLSQLCASRELLIQHYEKKVKKIAELGLERKAVGYEPGSGWSRKIDKFGFEMFASRYPNVDIRHGRNLSGSGRTKIEHFKNKNTCKNFKEYMVDQIPHWNTEFLLSL